MTEGMRDYSVGVEIAGPAAIFTRPDFGASFIFYPAQTYSAAKSTLDCVARSKTAHMRRKFLV